ncbi:SDR family NAD(P)-dependent oxidoreductase [Paenibacillus mucilaginosus]|uniref:Oxidoreductase, short-chain dehydrogenase/reductase n=3 Tax=Paenibacillus mucilaginosus TaxID=61624 RepID=H6NDB3_9BACL|nr:SDR family NAD(P)-dependent oxidoreductase [Paenibacillus mucilaginosus]AEI42933.1 Oxidoreductase, short-chain dehydrogenase/reductase [Paenibacillus mucilaginosus KNP414]AFC30626.1 Oxidoreductase, short-chain dehydrogenase/reductase [Paenibacillus mucilaginosus 3016]AFH62937.1 short-chain dehydrogenase [Paenibacillus mucilaginosus K02]MCG7216048.1 SDR family NAD(P)-dependent oxidoreductase [Paenibacillus mucilaginosus]WDM24577.1 SDR family NAD(P)-dependent oxidoreductase [Paenibacillus muc
MKIYYLITGTSSGIGEALAAKALQNGMEVCGISLGMSGNLVPFDHYRHINYDIRETAGLEPIAATILKNLDTSRLDMICLINNAGTVEPLQSFETCGHEAIGANILTNLIAPMVLTSSFIKYTENYPIRRKVVNISSAASIYPLSGMGTYCTAKAGINMFTSCVGAEQADKPNPVEIIAVDPGMVDTEMQLRCRETERFAMAEYFRGLQNHNGLISAARAAENIHRMIERKYERGKLLSPIGEVM